MNPKTPKTPENTTDKEQYTSIFDAPTAVSEKPVKKRRISKRALNTIVALVVCAALGAGAFAAVSPCSMAQSATKRSKRPMPTGSPLMPRTHLLSHWFSCGHTRPQIAGRPFWVRMVS